MRAVPVLLLAVKMESCFSCLFHIQVGDVTVTVRLRHQMSSQSSDREGGEERRGGRVTVLTGAQLAGGASVNSEVEPLPTDEDLSFVAEEDDGMHCL